MRNFFTFIGEVSHFGLKGLVDAFRPPFEWEFFLIQIKEIGWQSLPLILAAGLALGIVLSMHTRGTLVQFGAEAMIPTLQSASFFNELGPLVTGLLVAGRVGAGIGAGIANMRVTEQIDAITTMGVSPIQYLVVPRVIATTLMMPLLATCFGIAGMAGAYVVAVVWQGIDPGIFFERVERLLTITDLRMLFIKSLSFGFVVSVVCCKKGFFASGGARGVGDATAKAVVASIVAIFGLDYVLTTLLTDI